jgi:hypothetical protein
VKAWVAQMWGNTAAPGRVSGATPHHKHPSTPRTHRPTHLAWLSACCAAASASCAASSAACCSRTCSSILALNAALPPSEPPGQWWWWWVCVCERCVERCCVRAASGLRGWRSPLLHITRAADPPATTLTPARRRRCCCVALPLLGARGLDLSGCARCVHTQQRDTAGELALVSRHGRTQSGGYSTHVVRADARFKSDSNNMRVWKCAGAAVVGLWLRGRARYQMNKKQ